MHIQCCSLPPGLPRRERQLAGYSGQANEGHHPRDLPLSVGLVPAGATFHAPAQPEVVLPSGQARRRAKCRAVMGSQPVVIPLGQAQRKSDKFDVPLRLIAKSRPSRQGRVGADLSSQISLHLIEPLQLLAAKSISVSLVAADVPVAGE